MSWNYRIFEETKLYNGISYNEYTIREVYYKENNDDNPTGYTEDPMKPEYTEEPAALLEEDKDLTIEQRRAKAKEEIKSQLKQMLEAVDKEILTEKDFKKIEA